MKPRCTEEDVARWIAVDQQRLSAKLAQLNDPSFAGRKDFVLSGLHLLHESLGYSHLALSNYALARQHFVESCEYVLRIFELPDEGEPVAHGRLVAGYCESWLIAIAAGAVPLAVSLAEAFSRNCTLSSDQLSGTEQVAFALRALLNHDHAEALRILQLSRSPEPITSGYRLPALDGIASSNEQLFRDSLTRASEHWRSVAARAHVGLPQSVAFIGGLGLLRLAELLFGHKIDVKLESMPSELLAPSQAT